MFDFYSNWNQETQRQQNLLEFVKATKTNKKRR